jgi:hypothetical protein
MATILGVLVGFGMFGAMLTIPLYLQIVTGLTPTESGFALLPMILGLMIASIGSGQILSRTGHYRIFPVTGTFVVAAGYLVLTFLTIDKPLWFLMIAMFLIGLGLGQLMQTLTIASQNSVEAHQMGVATSASTFFRQIGGTLGVAVLLSVLFSALPGNVLTAQQNKADLTAGLDAALTPSVASAPENAAVMKLIWSKSVDPIENGIKGGVDAANAQIAALPAAAQPAALQKASQNLEGAPIENGKLVADFSNAEFRSNVVDSSVPKILKTIKDVKPSGSVSSDTSFLNGADERLTRTFLVGFNNSVVTVYWIGMLVILLAFVLTWFFKVPPLRKTSALQEQADKAGMTETGSIRTALQDAEVALSQAE